MKLNFAIRCLVLSGSLIACKKSSYVSPTDPWPDKLNQSIVYKTVATVPSPADSAKGLLRDSLSVSRSLVNNNQGSYLTNIPFVSSYSYAGFGFSFGYNDPNKSLPYFTFTAYAFPNVSRDFQVNKTYEHTSIPGSIYQNPIFLGSHDGFGGMTYFVNNVFPPDAVYPPASTVYTRVTFTKKLKVARNVDTLFIASGKISGYCINRYSPTDTSKYVHRWDFTVDFQDLVIEE